ncbi:MAG: flagellar protein export ATPase FliI [Pseudomonadota bacterium]
MNSRSANLPRVAKPPVEGIVTRMVGMTLEAVGCQAAIGARCNVIAPGMEPVEAEVVGFAADKLFLMPTKDIQGLVPNARVIPSDRVYRVPVGDSLLGRVLSGGGQPLDSKGPLHTVETAPLQSTPVNPLKRKPIDEILDVGVRAINSLLSVGRGQRLGLFAGSGVGKSVLMGMMTRYTSADVVVVGLIGERGREVKEFVQDILGEDGLKRSVVVAAPADTSPLNRLHGAMLSHSIAEYFRDQGKSVLLLMDSLTRFAQAQREISLAIGELPATKGYPPSVFARLPQLVERTGNGFNNQGSITAFYTVLVEGDDNNDPIADASRAILDGHLVLSRDLAQAGHFPAIDIEASISRAMNAITDDDQQQLVRQFRRLYSLYQENRDLISVGAYQHGSSSEIDQAILMFPQLQAFLLQNMNEAVSSEASMLQLRSLLRGETPVATNANLNNAHA